MPKLEPAAPAPGHRMKRAAQLDGVYRGCRVTIKAKGAVLKARITHARGTVLPISAEASLQEGAETCLRRAATTLDRYLAFVGVGSGADL